MVRRKGRKRRKRQEEKKKGKQGGITARTTQQKSSNDLFQWEPNPRRQPHSPEAQRLFGCCTKINAVKSSMSVQERRGRRGGCPEERHLWPGMGSLRRPQKQGMFLTQNAVCTEHVPQDTGRQANGWTLQMGLLLPCPSLQSLEHW